MQYLFLLATSIQNRLDITTTARIALAEILWSGIRTCDHLLYAKFCPAPPRIKRYGCIRHRGWSSSSIHFPSRCGVAEIFLYTLRSRLSSDDGVSSVHFAGMCVGEKKKR